MENIKIYKVVDVYNNILYVGQSVNPESRLSNHVSRKDGKFYGRKDLSIEIIAECYDRVIATFLEEIFQIKYNLVTDIENRRKGRKNYNEKVEIDDNAVAKILKTMKDNYLLFKTQL